MAPSKKSRTHHFPITKIYVPENSVIVANVFKSKVGIKTTLGPRRSDQERKILPLLPRSGQGGDLSDWCCYQ